MRPRQNPVIVIAEDNDDTRRVYALILRHFGYEVEEASTGEDAVELVRRTQPNLVLMDIGLPKLDGWQASRVLKADPATRAIPLIAFSAYIDCAADLGGAMTFDGYILKPIAPNELARRVESYLKLLVPKHIIEAPGTPSASMTGHLRRSTAEPSSGAVTPRRTGS